MGTLPQILEIIFELKRKRKMYNEKIIRKKKSTYKTRFLLTPPIFKLHKFLKFYFK
jgi:hypothetical protein